MKKVRKALAVVVMAGVVTCALAARLVWDFEGAPDDAGRMTSATSAPAAAAAGTRVNGSQSLIPWGSLTLAGDVVELSAPDAPLTVTLSDGQRSYAARVNGTGYTAVLTGYPPGSPNRMITVEVRSTRVHYVSVLGSYARLQSLAGADKHLSLQEQPSLRVSPYTTALAWLVRQARNNVDATTDAEFELGVRATDGKEVIIASYLLGSTATGERALPDGYEDGYAALRSQSYFAVLYNYTAYYAAAIQYLRNAPFRAPLASLQELPQETVLNNALSVTGYPMYSTSTVLLQRQGADTFDVLESQSLTNPRYSALLDAAGDVRLQATGAVTRTIIGDGGIPYTYFYLGYTLRRLYRGEKYSQWVLAWSYELRDSANEVVSTGESLRVLTGVDMASWRQPDGMNLVNAAQRILPWPCVGGTPVKLDICAYGIYQRWAGGYAVDAEYKVNDDLSPRPPLNGGLTIPLGSLDAQGGLHLANADSEMVIWRVDRPSLALGTIVYVTRSTSSQAAGQVRVDLGFTTVMQDPADLHFDPVGSWTDGRGHYQVPYNYRGWRTVERSAGGSGFQSFNNPESTPYVRDLTWQAQSGRTFDHYFNSNTTPGLTCAAWFALGYPDCQTEVIHFNPLLRLDNRFYGLQETYQRTEYPDGTYTLVRSSHPNFMTCDAGQCASVIAGAAAMAAPTAVNARPAMQARTRFEAGRNPYPRIGELRSAARANVP